MTCSSLQACTHSPHTTQIPGSRTIISLASSGIAPLTGKSMHSARVQPYSHWQAFAVHMILLRRIPYNCECPVLDVIKIIRRLKASTDSSKSVLISMPSSAGRLHEATRVFEPVNSTEQIRQEPLGRSCSCLHKTGYYQIHYHEPPRRWFFPLQMSMVYH